MIKILRTLFTNLLSRYAAKLGASFAARWATISQKLAAVMSVPASSLTIASAPTAMAKYVVTPKGLSKARLFSIAASLGASVGTVMALFGDELEAVQPGLTAEMRDVLSQMPAGLIDNDSNGIPDVIEKPTSPIAIKASVDKVNFLIRNFGGYENALNVVKTLHTTSPDDFAVHAVFYR